MEYNMEPFAEVKILGRWPVILPDYRVQHCKAQANWEEGRLLSMHAHLEPGDVLYDVGAEHGDLSALYATWLRSPADTIAAHAKDMIGPELGTVPRRGGVVLVEGSDKFWPVIRATFEANGLVPVGCYAGFASDVDSPDSERGPGWADPAFTRPGDVAGRRGWPSWAEWEPVAHHGFKSLVESKQTIQNIRFDTLEAWVGPPDALTIDVEGAELRVLHGAERILREVRPLVWVSVHPTLMAHDYPQSGVLGTGDPDYERARVVTFMEGLGYLAQFLEANHEEHFLFWPLERTGFDPWLGVEHLKP